MFPYIAAMVIICVLSFCAFLIKGRFWPNSSKKKSKSDKKKETEPTTKEAKPTDGPESKKPAAAKKPWPKKVKAGIVVLVLLLVAVAAYRVFDVQVPDFRFTNEAFWVFLPILLLGGLRLLSSKGKKVPKVLLTLFLGMALVFWHFDVPILQMADQDREEYGYNSMDFEPAVELLDTVVVFDVSKPFWSPAGLYIPPNSMLTITAEGGFMWDPKVCSDWTGPEGASWLASEVYKPDQFQLRDEPIACFMGKIGKEVFLIGKATSFRVEKQGELQLAINERWKRHCWNDNSGKLIVRIRVG